MSKFCTTCGATLEDAATFCTTCGAAQGEQATTPEAGTAANVGDTLKNTFNNVKDKVDVDAIKGSLSVEGIKDLKNNPNPVTIGILAGGAVLVILILVLLINIIFGGAYKKPLDNMAKALTKESASAYMKTQPEYLIDAVEKELKKSKDSDYDDAEDVFQEAVEGEVEDLEEEFGKNVKVSYKITDKEKLDKKDLKNCKDYLKKYMGAKNSVKVTKGYELEVEVKYKGKEADDTMDKVITVAKVDGKWCIVRGDFSYYDASKYSSYSDYDLSDLLDDFS